MLGGQELQRHKRKQVALQRSMAPDHLSSLLHIVPAKILVQQVTQVMKTLPMRKTIQSQIQRLHTMAVQIKDTRMVMLKKTAQRQIRNKQINLI